LGIIVINGILKHFKERLLVSILVIINLKNVKNPMGMRSKDTKKKYNHFEQDDDKIKKTNIKKTYKIKNSNLIKMIEFLNKEN
jgi:hypothetical protein